HPPYDAEGVDGTETFGALGTASIDTGTNRICADVTGFSDFIVVFQGPHGNSTLTPFAPPMGTTKTLGSAMPIKFSRGSLPDVSTDDAPIADHPDQCFRFDGAGNLLFNLRLDP